MPRLYNRKTPKRDEATIQNAVNAVLNGSSKKAAAKQFNIPRTTLSLHVDNKKAEPNAIVKIAGWGRQTVRSSICFKCQQINCLFLLGV